MVFEHPVTTPAVKHPAWPVAARRANRWIRSGELRQKPCGDPYI